MAVPAPGPCRALIAGFGVPAQRDLDFGRQVIRYLEPFAWPNGVVVEDLSYAAHLVLHRLQELEPSKLVLVGATARGVDVPGNVRRRRIDAASSDSPDVVQQHVAQSVGGVVDLDHTLAVLRHWGGLPADTVLLEVEAADCSWGTGFSDELAPCFDTILALLREELGDDAPTLNFTPDAFRQENDVPGRFLAGKDETAVPEGLAPLVDFADRRREAKLAEQHRGDMSRTLTDGDLVVAGRHRPWTIGLDSGSDWYDTIPLDHGATGIVIGSVPGRGADAAGLKSDMRVAARAYAVLEGRFPARLVSCLDRMASTTGIGSLTCLTYLTIQPDTGEVHLCAAGLCPPVLLNERGAQLLDGPVSAPLGGAGHRVELTVRLEPGQTLLFYTDGLVRGPVRSLAQGQAALLDAAMCGPTALDALCDHIVGACLNHQRRDEDATVVALRLDPQRSWDRISAE